LNDFHFFLHQLETKSQDESTQALDVEKSFKNLKSSLFKSWNKEEELQVLNLISVKISFAHFLDLLPYSAM